MLQEDVSFGRGSITENGAFLRLQGSQQAEEFRPVGLDRVLEVALLR
jgi:hypothetical protein